MRATAPSLRACARECPLERNESANEGVVAPVGRVAEPLAETAVEPVLGVVETCRHIESELKESGAADRDEQGFVADDIPTEVGKTCLDKVTTRKHEQVRGHAQQSTCRVD